MKNKEFCLSDRLSLLEGAFDSDNGNIVIKKAAKKLVSLSDAGAKFYGRIAVVPPENGKYRLVDASIADLLEGISITLDSNDRESAENALLNKIVQLEGQPTLCAIFAVSHLAWSLMIGRILLNKHMVEP